MKTCFVYSDHTLGECPLRRSFLGFFVARDETAELANSGDLDEVSHVEPPHQDLHCLPSCL